MSAARRKCAPGGQVPGNGTLHVSGRKRPRAATAGGRAPSGKGVLSTATKKACSDAARPRTVEPSSSATTMSATRSRNISSLPTSHQSSSRAARLTGCRTIVRPSLRTTPSATKPCRLRSAAVHRIVGLLPAPLSSPLAPLAEGLRITVGGHHPPIAPDDDHDALKVFGHPPEGGAVASRLTATEEVEESTATVVTATVRPDKGHGFAGDATYAGETAPECGGRHPAGGATVRGCVWGPGARAPKSVPCKRGVSMSLGDRIRDRVK